MAKIMIIEDLLVTRKLLAEILIDEGHRVVGAFADVKDAIETVKSEKPDLILLDYRLKAYENGYEITGLDVLKRIKMIDKNIHVVFITAFANKQLIKDAVLFGATDFIVKPFSTNDLIDRINTKLAPLEYAGLSSAIEQARW